MNMRSTVHSTEVYFFYGRKNLHNSIMDIFRPRPPPLRPQHTLATGGNASTCLTERIMTKRDESEIAIMLMLAE
jgi:hypothetical protein